VTIDEDGVASLDYIAPVLPFQSGSMGAPGAMRPAGANTILKLNIATVVIVAAMGLVLLLWK
jgi:hypothetical protein